MTNRPLSQVLKIFQMSVLKGQSVALVGPSGCGKSTCVALLQVNYTQQHLLKCTPVHTTVEQYNIEEYMTYFQRFYDLSSGEINLEKHDLQVTVAESTSTTAWVVENPSMTLH